MENKSLIPIKKLASGATTTAAALTINRASDVAQATILRSKVKNLAKQIDEKKKEITAPINASLKSIRALFAPLEDSCTTAARIIDTKIIAYNRGIEEIRRKEEEKLMARVEKGSLLPATAAKKMEAVPEAKRHVSTEEGSISITKIRKFEVIDIALLPMEYHLPNEVMIRKSMYEGREVPGVEYYTEDSVMGR